ncbi:hypothetical protein Fmac_012197 [Flemingia macrophylla]|uniref:SGNH hydrolase-type esterase domain-containing protein n=1 Tax=Flemingia macrophylla TaxID=520843 RepID=A0ABD1MPM3_9FABA
MVGPVRPQFVLFGSSIVEFSYSNEGWGATLANLYARKADVILRGYAGWNSRRALQVLDKIFPKDATIQPSLVIVYFGGNDSTHPHPSGHGFHVPLQEYIENMRKIAIHLLVHFHATFLAFSTHDMKKQKVLYLKDFNDLLGQFRRTNESCRVYSEACLELCREMNVKAIDLWSALQQRHDRLDVCFTDGIHLSSEGSKIVAKEILKVLREADWEPCLHWNSMPNEFAEDSPYDPTGADEKTLINISSLKFQGNSQLE